MVNRVHANPNCCLEYRLDVAENKAYLVAYFPAKLLPSQARWPKLKAFEIKQRSVASRDCIAVAVLPSVPQADIALAEEMLSLVGSNCQPGLEPGEGQGTATFSREAGRSFRRAACHRQSPYPDAGCREDYSRMGRARRCASGFPVEGLRNGNQDHAWQPSADDQNLERPSASGRYRCPSLSRSDCIRLPAQRRCFSYRDGHAGRVVFGRQLASGDEFQG